MHTVIIYGASDDLIEVKGEAEGCDEYYGENAVIVVHGVDGATTRVCLNYHSEGFLGLWAITAGPTEDGVPMVPCKIELSKRYDDSWGYSSKATFEGVERVDVEVAPDA